VSKPLLVSVSGTDITVSLQTSGAGVVLSTAAQVVTAVNALLTASTLVLAAFTGTGAGLAGESVFVPVLGARLTPDAGPLVWALLPFPQLQIRSASSPLGVVEQEGVDLTITPPSTVSSDVANFTGDDVGKNFVIRGSALGQDEIYEIDTVVSSKEATLIVAAPLLGEAALNWEVRTLSLIGDQTEAVAFAPSLIQYLALDFAIPIDTRESESRQRSWVGNVNQWINLKGLAKAYQILGAISGFDVTASGLYRVSLAVALGIPSAGVFFVGETGPGRLGLDGYFTAVGPRLVFTSPSALFKPSDVGVSIRADNCSNVLNNGIYTIDNVLSAQSVELLLTDSAVTPDYGVGGAPLTPKVRWTLVRIYTTYPPTKPLYDDINVELMQEIVGPANFVMDHPCWDPALITSFPVSITIVSPLVVVGSPIYFDLTVSGVAVPGPTFSSCAVIGAVGRWTITDFSGTTFYVETVPTLVAAGPPAVHTFKVFAAQVPVVGAATLEYNCEPQETCDYCKSSVVLADIVEGDILNEMGVHVEKILARVVDRLNTEPKPAHVQLIPLFRRTFAAGLTLTATVTTP
jgi:hypothetical protein